jgi:hypothetical protein
MLLSHLLYKLQFKKSTSLISMQVSLTDAVITFTIPNLIIAAITHTSLKLNWKVN